MARTQVQWGIVGTGDISASIAPDFTLTENAALTAVSSRAKSSAEEFSVRFGVPAAYQGIEGLLQDPAIDAVYLGTPHGTHHALALKVLAAGKHVLVEKPMALNSSQVREICSEAQGRGLLAMEGMWTKFNPTFQDVMATVASGAIGQVRSLQASFGLPFPSDSGSRWSAEMGGSTLLDQGIYPITLAQMIFGDPLGVQASGSLKPNGVDLTVRVTLEYSEGRFAQLAASMVEYIDPSASINGVNGWISVPAPFWATNTFTLRSGSIPEAFGQPEHRETIIEGNGFVPMIRAASTSILAGHREQILHPTKDLLAVFAVLDEVRSQLAAAALARETDALRISS